MNDTSFWTAVGSLAGLWIILFIIRIIIWILVSIKFAEIAEIKGHSRSYGFWVYFLGIIGIIMVAILPDRNASVDVTGTVRIQKAETPKPYIRKSERNEELPEI